MDKVFSIVLDWVFVLEVSAGVEKYHGCGVWPGCDVWLGGVGVRVRDGGWRGDDNIEGRIEKYHGGGGELAGEKYREGVRHDGDSGVWCGGGRHGDDIDDIDIDYILHNFLIWDDSERIVRLFCKYERLSLSHIFLMWDVIK